MCSSDLSIKSVRVPIDFRFYRFALVELNSEKNQERERKINSIWPPIFNKALFSMFSKRKWDKPRKKWKSTKMSAKNFRSACKAKLFDAKKWVQHTKFYIYFSFLSFFSVALHSPPSLSACLPACLPVGRCVCVSMWTTDGQQQSCFAVVVFRSILKFMGLIAAACEFYWSAFASSSNESISCDDREEKKLPTKKPKHFCVKPKWIFDGSQFSFAGCVVAKMKTPINGVDSNDLKEEPEKKKWKHFICSDVDQYSTGIVRVVSIWIERITYESPRMFAYMCVVVFSL